MTMLTETELNTLRNWKYKVEDHSFISRLLQSFWNYQIEFFPSYVHPNLISLAGFFCVLYAFTLTMRFEASLRLAVAVVALTNIYTNLDALDGKQARRTKSSSPIGELFDHALDNVSMVMSILSLLHLYQCEERFITLSWIFALSVAFLSFHLEAYLAPNHLLVFGALTAQNEAMVVYSLIILYPYVKELFPIISLPANIEYACQHYMPYAVLYAAGMYLVIKLVQAFKRWHRVRAEVAFSEHHELYSIVGLTLTYLIRVFGQLASDDSTTLGYLCEGFILSIPTTEIILCKMSGKHFNPLIIIITMASVVDNYLAIAGALGYYVYMFYYLTIKLNIPFFRIKTRVYCCGVFDMCHRGHMILFQRTAELGDEVIVGVHSDEDVASYKRVPNVKHSERCDTVAVCKYVTEVIPFAPLCMDEDFIKKHNIHLVVCSDEYDDPNDKYYAVPRRMGILKVLTRTAGISSSELMKIIMARKKD